MSYKVLYRKYRPTNFNDVIDQKFITDTLKESIINNKISHAYIFSGPKGTGKTSTAKVFAKAINCENPVNGEPCEKCSSCLNFGTNPDIIELDAASNNGVDDIRELINNVKLAPTNSKYKVYIIDEVHMLTNSASNAFLLTLEEPPSHAIFILATTNPESLPSTILSRCQQFAFSKISKKAITSRIKDILDKEQIKIADDVIAEIVSLADGGMRDALSILDQLVTLNQPITVDLLTEQFGIISETKVSELIDSIINNDLEKINNLFNQYNEYGISEKSFLNKFIHLLTEKSCDLKNNNDDSNLEKLKTITMEIVNMNQLKNSFNYYDVIKMIIISNLDNNNISREINFSSIKPVIEEKHDSSSENISSKIENEVDEDKKEDIAEVNNSDNLQSVNKNDDFEEIKQIRINNSFAGANKQLKLEFESKFNDYIDLLKSDNEIYSLLVDTCIGAVSPTNAIVITETDASANLLNEKSEKIIKKGKFLNKKLVFLSNSEWESLVSEYKKKLKDGFIYSYIEEPVIVEKDKLENLADDIFGEENIIIEEE